MACNCMGCPHAANCRCRCKECHKEHLVALGFPRTEVESYQDIPLGVLLISTRPLTEAEKKYPVSEEIPP